MLWSSWMVMRRKYPMYNFPQDELESTQTLSYCLCYLQPMLLFVSFFNFSLCYIYLLCVHVWCGSQGLNSGHEAWQQAALLDEPSNQPQLVFLLTLLARHKLISFSFCSVPIWSPVCLKFCPVAFHTTNSLLFFQG